MKPNEHVYISLPMSGRSELDISAHISRVMSCLSLNPITASWIVTNPMQIAEAYKSCCPEFSETPFPDLPYHTLMGKDIAHILSPDCTAVIMCRSWQTSRGCQLERQTAAIYGRTIYYEEDLVP